MKKRIYFLIAMVSFSFSGIAQDLAGSWKGELNVMGQKLPLLFHFESDGNGWKGTMDSPKQGAKGIALSDVLYEGGMLSVELSAGGIAYEGILVGDLIKGTFVQGGMSLPLDLKKIEEGDVEMTPKRPQLPQAPFDYEIIETSFRNLDIGVTLSGTLTKPSGIGPFPAVVLVSGSGPQNRNSEIFGHQPFWVLADYLTRQGIVVLRYDERGVGDSEGEFSSASSLDFKKDADVAIAHLRKFPSVDQTKIGVIGHSEGGLIAWMLGAENRNLDYVLALAPPVVPIPDLMIKQTEETSKSLGLPEAIVRQQVAFNSKFYDFIQESKSPEDAKNKLPEFIENVLDDDRLTEDQKTKQKAALMNAYAPNLNPWFFNFINTNPEEYIEKIKIPVFAAFGGRDIQVNAALNANRLQELFKGRRNRLLELQVYPELNHLFQMAETGSIAEYEQIGETINERVLQDIAAFILDQ